jgi:hypothetical protein
MKLHESLTRKVTSDTQGALSWSSTTQRREKLSLRKVSNTVLMTRRKEKENKYEKHSQHLRGTGHQRCGNDMMVMYCICSCRNKLGADLHIP